MLTAGLSPAALPLWLIPNVIRMPPQASSPTWTIEFIAHDLSFTNTDWWRYFAEIEYGADGYHHIAAKLWQPDGKLAAISRQTVTLFA